MPVQSKIFAGRAKKPPPVPAPKPILKSPDRPRDAIQRPTDLALLNGPNHSESQKVEFTFPGVNNAAVNDDGSWDTEREARVLGYHRRGPLMYQYGAVGGDQTASPGKGNAADSEVTIKPDLREDGPQIQIARARHSRPPVRQSIGGDWALKECEELTDWANDVLKQKKLPLITDLRKSVGDGYTLPTILEIVSGVTLNCVKVSPQTKQERVENLRKCLAFLVKRGCDITSADPTELEDGNLKSSLLLVGSIRKHFQKTYTPTLNGHVDNVSPSRESPPPALPSRRMPGAIKLPGAVPTPFLAGRDPSPVRGKNVPSSPNRKSSLRDEDLLPGSFNREPNSGHSKPHSALISTTELGTNGVSQHGVEERRQHTGVTASTPNRGILLRSSTGKAAQTPPLQETGAPQAVTRAWTASPTRPHVSNTNVNGSSVEDRLRQLFNNNSQNNNAVSSNDKQGFHGGGSEVFDDGELLVVPPPQSRNSPDFELMMLDNHGYGPGYRHHTSQHRGQRSNQGYVPSKPGERWLGSRAEVILSRKPEPSPTLVRARTQPASQVVPGMTRGQDNRAFNHDASGQGLRSGKNTPDHLRGKPPSPRKAGGNDLRSAWNKLYGAHNTPPPHGVTLNQSPLGASNSSLNRGDNLRSSYGPDSPSRNQHNTSQYSVSFAPSPPPLSSRPLSAPAPAHMQVHFENLGHGHQTQGHSPSQERLEGHFQGQSGVTSSTQRESPMGQSTSTQGQLDGSMSSQLTSGSHGDQGQLNLSSSMDKPGKSSFQTAAKSSLNSPSSVNSPNSPNSPNCAIGPGAKYPEMGSRPSSAKNRISGSLVQGSPAVKHKDFKHVSDSHTSGSNSQGIKQTNINSPHRHKRFSEDLTKALKTASRGNLSQKSFDYSFDEMNNSRDLKDQSIFDYEASQSESSGSVTPPLPPLSPTVTPPDSPELSPTLPRSHSATNVSHTKMHETMQGSGVQDKRKPRRTSELQFRMHSKHHHRKGRNPQMKPKGANLNDLKEDSDIDSNLSFDIDDTILTVESHDTEQHPAGEILTSHEAAALRQQLKKLETMYSELQQKVEPEKDQQGLGPPPIGRQRRWSIGSSDTSSFRRESRHKPGKHTHHRHQSKEFKNINKRFQRLESHVVTLARSVAHLSSELRTHNTMVNDLESVKRDLREFKENPGMPFPRVPGTDSSTEFDRFRGWGPSVTNTKRVNKLTKFFGAEPPLLELFLKKLCYEKYVPNFKSEHIGMMELPYMTEERLEKIGIPMGPRARIIQEAQMCFRHETFKIYVV